MALACALALAPSLTTGSRPPAAAVEPQAGTIAAVLRGRLAADPELPELYALYAKRSFQPLWVDAAGPTPAAYVLAARLRRARDDGLDPQDYGVAALTNALHGARTAQAQADLELALSRAYGRFAVDVRDPPAAAVLEATDPALARRRLTPTTALAQAIRAPSLLAHVQALIPANPVYQGLRRALAAHRAGKPADAPFDAYEQTLALNLARARALPPEADDRFVLVDAASAQLWLYEDGRVTATMPVAVGTVHDPTPLMSGMIRYAAYHPYWYVPPDLARETYAPIALSHGPAAITADGLEVLSDWTDQASVVDPATVDWQAVADGRALVRLRQRPGPDNMMGSVKLMLPNRFGVYLHDTPNHSVFAAAARNFSHGCVRLSDARALARLLGAPPPAGDIGGAEERVDLPQPTPVYIAYFTALAPGGRVALAPDVYRRDAPLLAELSAGRRTGAVEFAAR
jgi:murein L,D-transpeptidase YcbB/YkuD